MEMLLEEQEPPADDILRHMQKTLGADQIVPVFMGVAERDMGVRRLLEALIKETPPPSVAAARIGVDPSGDTLVQVLKNYHLPHAGKLCLARVWAGEVKDGMTLGGMRVGGVFRMFGGQHNNVPGAGGRRDRRARPARGGQDRPDARQRRRARRRASCRPPTPLAPMYAFALSAENRNDEVKLSARDRQAGRRGPEPALRAGPRAAAEPALGPGRDAPAGRARPAALQVPHRDRGPAAPDRLSRDHPQGHPEPRPAQEAERRPRPVRRRQDRDPAAPARRGLRVRRQDRRRLGAAPVHPGGRGRRARVSCSAARSASRWSTSASPCSTASSTASTARRSRSRWRPRSRCAKACRSCDPVLLEPILAVEISVPSEYTSRALPAGQPEARPDPGLRRQGRTGAAGTGSRPTSRRPRSTT